MKPENRSKRMSIRIKPSEKAYLRREADERGQRIPEYVRAILFANAVLISHDEKK